MFFFLCLCLSFYFILFLVGDDLVLDSSVFETIKAGKMRMEDLGEGLHFFCRADFWRMALCWTVCLVLSYFKLLVQTLFVPESKCYPRCSPATAASGTPVCIITGVSMTINISYSCRCFIIYPVAFGMGQATSGLGAAAAYALSKEGFYIILGILPFFTFLPLWLN